MNEHSCKQAFHHAYSTFSTVIYSSALRISGNKAFAQKILSEVFVDLHRQGLLEKPGLLHFSNLLPTLFHCATAVLKPELPEQVIHDRITDERHYLSGQLHLHDSHVAISA